MPDGGLATLHGFICIAVWNFSCASLSCSPTFHIVMSYSCGFAPPFLLVAPLTSPSVLTVKLKEGVFKQVCGVHHIINDDESVPL